MLAGTASYGVVMRFSWRGRMGVEPTSEGSTPTHTVLKTGEATGPHPPPCVRRQTNRPAERDAA
jgi:hypothetical protein